MKSLALAAALLTAGSSASVEFKPSRRVTQLRVGQCDVAVTFSLRVADGGSEEYYCPRVVFEWEDGTRSSVQSDCPAFDKAGPEDHRLSWTRTRTFQPPGTYSVRAHLCHGETRIRTVQTAAVVLGWDGYTADRRAEYGCSVARDQISTEYADPLLSRGSPKNPCA